MPPLIYFVLCWIAGAFLGSAATWSAAPNHWLVPGVALAAGAVGALQAAGSEPRARRGAAVWPLLLMVVASSSVLYARSVQQQMAYCRTVVAAAINRGAVARIVLDDHVRPRASSRGEIEGAGMLHTCRVPVVVRVTAGTLAPGEWASFQGRATVTGSGLRVDGTLSPDVNGTRSWWRSMRGRAGDVIDRDFGKNAPLVRALLIADQDGIDASVRDTFADAGLVHLLSVSGLHVAIIAGSLLTLAGAMRLSRAAAFVMSVVVIGAYIMVLGAPPPAVRSGIMLTVMGISERWQRPVHPWTALALGAALPTVQPEVVLQLGYQLSVAGMAALVAARAMLWRMRTLPSARCAPRVRNFVRWYQNTEGWRYALLREGFTGIIATLVTAPLIAWTFGRLSIVAPLSNIAAGPLIAFAQPALFLGLLLSPWPTISQLVADATIVPLSLLDAVATWAARIPFASLHVAPTALGAACAGLAAAAFIWATGSRRVMPGLITAAVALTGAVWSPAFLRGSGQLELHVLDVGQGDALALRTPRGRWILVDAGRVWDGGDSGKRVVVPYIRRLGGTVAAFIMSHAHDDHVGGAASVMAALRPTRWWEPAFVTRSAAYRAALQTVQRQHGSWHRVRPNDQWQLDNVDIRVLAPDSAWTAAQTDANESSVVLRVQYGNVAFLLTGDAEAAEEEWVVAHTDSALLQADVLKLGHHGSKTSSTPAFLDAVRPRLGVASVGVGNRYGHPSPEILDALAARNVPVLRTDSDGTIVVATDGRSLTVRVGREEWQVPRR